MQLNYCLEWLQSLTPKLLQSRLSDFQKMHEEQKWLDGEHNKAVEDQAKSAKLLEVLKNRDYSSTVRNFPNNWNLIMRLGARSSLVELSSRILRHQYLAAYVLAWQWLVDFVEHIMDSLKSTNSHVWYIKLSKDITNNVNCRVS